MLVRLLGASAMHLFSGQAFADLSPDEQLTKLGKLFSAASYTGGKATDPDEFEAGCRELLAYTTDNGGEGVCYSTEPLEPGSPGWVPMRGLETLDMLDGLDHATVYALIWEIIKLNFRPTSAGSGTNAGTGPAASTSPDASPTSSEPSSSRPSTPTVAGSPQRRTRPATGISGA